MVSVMARRMAQGRAWGPICSNSCCWRAPSSLTPKPASCSSEGSPAPVGGDQIGRDGAEPKPLTHHLRRDAEPGAGIFGAPALVFRNAPEGLELIDRMHGLAGDVLIERYFVAVVVSSTATRTGWVRLIALRLASMRSAWRRPIADSDEISHSGLAVSHSLYLDHGRLQHALAFIDAAEALRSP